MWGWGSVCTAAHKIDKTVREDAPAKLKQYTPDQKQLQNAFRYCTGSLSGRYSAERMRENQKMMWGNWDTICYVAGKIDKTVREDAFSKFGAYIPDPRVFLANFGKHALRDIIMDSGIPGVRLAFRSWEESMRYSQSGELSLLHDHGKENRERMSRNESEGEEREARLILLMLAAQMKMKPSQTQAILKIDAPTQMKNHPFSPDAVIKVLNQSQMADCSAQPPHIERDEK